MKKRSYRTVNVKKVDWDRLGEAVRGEDVIFGVDVGKEKVVGAVMVRSTAEVKLRVQWRHPYETESVVDGVLGLPSARTDVAMEPSGTYGDPMRWLFLSRGLDVFRVAPKRSHDAAEVFDGVASWHDAKSAGLIARLHREGASEPWPLRSAMERELGAEVRILEMYDKQEAANLNRLEGLLARHWPELTQVMKLSSATVAELVKEYGTPAAVAEDPIGARKLMRRVGRHFLKEEKIEAVVEDAGLSVGVPAIDRERQAIQETAVEVLRSRAEGKKVRARIERLVAEYPPVQRLATVVGKVTAAVLVSKLGDFEGYESVRALEKAFGMNLKEKSSGKHEGQLKITKRGPGVCRFYLYLAVLRLIRNDRVIAAWYERKVARDGGRYKLKAVVAVMRKVIAGLWHVGKGAKFDSTLLYDTVRLGLKETPRKRGSKARQRPTNGVSDRDPRTGLVRAGELIESLIPGQN